MPLTWQFHAPDPASVIPRCSETEPQAADKHDNSNVSKILPLTTLRTIDLAGRKIPGCLFSRFCAVSRVFSFVQALKAAERFRPALNSAT